MEDANNQEYAPVDLFRKQLRAEDSDIGELIASYPKSIRDELLGIAVADSLRAEIILSRDRLKELDERSEAVFVGAVMDQFRLEKLIGRGGMGEVYEAEQFGFERRVAVKVLGNRPIVEEDAIHLSSRFRLEATATGKLNHPNIVSAIAFGVTNEIPWLAMELIRGGSLAQTLIDARNQDKVVPSSADVFRLSSLSATQRSRWVIRIAKQLASALVHAHGKGVIHRDIKPSNIMIDVEGNAHITDFGLAQISNDDSGLTRSGEVVGTIDYMPPERTRADERTDIYGVGVCLWELLSGSRAIESGIVPIRERRSDVSEDLARIVDKCCAFHPDDRFQTAKELLRSLDKLQGDAGDSSRYYPGPAARGILRYISVCIIAVVVAVLFNLAVMFNYTPYNNGTLSAKQVSASAHSE